MRDFKDQLKQFKRSSNANLGAKSANVPEYMKDSADYVEIAEEVMNEIYESKGEIAFRKRKKPNSFGDLTTSKIRNVLAMVNDIYNDVVVLKENNLPPEIVDRIKYMKVRLIYEAGREPYVKYFVDKAELIDGIDSIGTNKNNFIRFSRYMEALVAYRKFLAKDD